MADAPVAETAPTPEAETTPQTTPDTTMPPEIKAIVDKERQSAKEAEKARKALEREVEQLRQQTMSDTEKAIAQAKVEARTEVLREVGSERVADAIRVATAGRNLDVDALLEGLDASRFLNEDGTPDRDAIAAWIDRIAPKIDEVDPDPVTPPTVDLGQGPRGAAASTMALNGDPLLKAVQSKLRH